MISSTITFVRVIPGYASITEMMYDFVLVLLLSGTVLIPLVVVFGHPNYWTPSGRRKRAALMRQRVNSWLMNLDQPETLDGYHKGLATHRIDTVRKQLEFDIEKSGWNRIRKRFTKAVRNSYGTCWYAENLFLTRVLQMEEYLGFGKSILDILKKIKGCTNLDEVKGQLITKLHPKLNAQVQANGNSVFLDIERYKDVITAMIIPDIIENRRSNFIESMNQFRLTECKPEGNINLSLLSQVLSTNYGFGVVMAIEKPSNAYLPWASILEKLDEVYDEVTINGSSTSSSLKERPDTPMIQLVREVAMDHVLKITGVQPLRINLDVDTTMMFKSGYSNIYDVFKSKRRINVPNYRFVRMILQSHKTQKASHALRIIRYLNE